MAPDTGSTFFGSAFRESPETVCAIAEKLEAIPHLRDLIEAAPQMTVILGRDRQVLMCNKAFSDAIPESSRESLLTMRPGEAVHCVESQFGPSGCGTAAECRTCGAMLAILDAQAGAHSVRECRINTTDPDGGPASMDLRVDAVPMRIAEEDVTMLSISDTAGEKMQALLERAFVHDIMNTASNIHQIVDIYRTAEAAEQEELLDDLEHVTHQLVDEIASQRDFMSAESGDLGVALRPSEPQLIFDRVAATYKNSRLVRAVRLEFRSNGLAGTPFMTDPTLLARVLGNLTKNALEASREGDCVRVWCERLDEDGISFHVHNAAVIPPAIQPGLFKRIRSTKGVNRGMGTYSAWLLTERYLRGRIRFESSADNGTEFVIELPAALSVREDFS